MYFWKQDRQEVTDRLPDLTVDTAKELKSYFEKLEMSPQMIGEQGLELLLVPWLTEIATTGRLRAKDDASMRWLVDSGLVERLEGARIELDPA